MIATGLFLLVAGTSLLACEDPESAPPERAWTVMIYGGSDNDSENSFCPDMAELRDAIPDGDDVAVLCLVDRSERYTATAEGFGEDFSDTRLYRFTRDRAERLDGGEAMPYLTRDSTFEADSGDATLLRDYIRFAKSTFPARHYGLIFYTHGNGWTFCPDESSGSDLFPAELTRVLTDEESLDLVVFDVCQMASLEDAWQWRPADGRFGIGVMVATPMSGVPFPWNRVLKRVRATDGGFAGLAPGDFGVVVVEETEAHRRFEESQPDHPPEAREVIAREAMSCLDLTKVGVVKSALDRLAIALAADDEVARDVLLRARGTLLSPTVTSYDRNTAYVDVHQFAGRIASDGAAPDAVRAAAEQLVAAADALVIASYGMSLYDGFIAGSSGVQMIVPPFGLTASDLWRKLFFYSPDACSDTRAFGHYDFCRDGGTPGDGEVTNWFELLDLVFDVDDLEEKDAGMNGYLR